VSSDACCLAGAALNPSGHLGIRDSSVGKVTALEDRGIVRYRAGMQRDCHCALRSVVSSEGWRDSPRRGQLYEANTSQNSGNCIYHQLQRTKLLHFTHTLYLCVLCGSENKQRLFPYTTLTDWFV
jgi:hypothetical protein